MAPPISIKLRCNSWKQLAALYKRDLTRSAVFLKSSAPPPLETPVRINLTLPNRDLVVLNGVVHEHVPPGGLNGRGPGVDIKLLEIPEEALARIHAALEVAQKEGVAVAKGKSGAAREKQDTPASQTSGSPDEAPEAPAASAGDAPGAPESASPDQDAQPTDDDASPEPAETAGQGAADSQPTPPPVSALDEDILGISDSGDAGDAEVAASAPSQPATGEDEPAPAGADDADELRARLEQERESLRKLNAFQILGVGYETTDEAVHEAFASLSERYHPDRFAGQAHEAARGIATEIFALIRAAHRLLESSEARERLREELAGEARAEQQEEPAAQEPPTPITIEDSESAPSEEQAEIPTKPVLVAEDGTPIHEASRDQSSGDTGVPAAPQEEIPTKPAVVSEGEEGQQQASAPETPAAGKGPATPPPIPTAKPPPIPKKPATTPPPVPTAKTTTPDDDDDDAISIALDEVQVPDSASEDDIPLIDLDEDEDEDDVTAPAPAAEAEAPVEEAVAEEEAPALAEDEEQAPAADQAFAAALGVAGAPQYNEAIALLEAGDFKGAASVYRVASRRDPDELGARVGYELAEGLKAMANRDRLEAAQRFEAALEMDPDNQRAAAELGEIRRQIVQERADALKRLRNLTEE